MINVNAFLDQAREAGVPDMQGGRLVARRLGSTQEMCELLLGLVLEEQKTCTYSLVEFLEEEGGLLAPGDRIVFLDADHEPRCLVELDDCEELPFNAVSARHTAGEGPAAREVSVWRRIHRAYWGKWLEARGQRFHEEVPVMWQSYRLLHPRGETRSAA
ncbi:ASCH domain-containing protein [Candidatus Foliamicus sp.]